jgi:hypothetical protein
MARYGYEKIRGHGIPEALEAILLGRSRLDAKVAVLKPLSSAISIGTDAPRAEAAQRSEGGRFISRQLCNVAASVSRERPQDNAALSGSGIDQLRNRAVGQKFMLGNSPEQPAANR